MQEAVPVGEGTMAAIMGASIDAVKGALEQVEGPVGLANINSAKQIVISGAKDAVAEAIGKIDGKAKYLPVSAPFHSEMMLPAEKKLAVDLDNIKFSDLKFPVVNNIEVKEMISGAVARESLKKQVTRPVYWHDTMLKFLEEKNMLKFAEIGAGRVLAGILKRTARDAGKDVTLINVRDLDEVNQLIMN